MAKICLYVSVHWCLAMKLRTASGLLMSATFLAIILSRFPVLKIVHSALPSFFILSRRLGVVFVSSMG